MRIGWSRELQEHDEIEIHANIDRAVDTLSAYHFAHVGKAKPSSSASQPTRYAVRQVLDQELRKARSLQASEARLNRGGGLLTDSARAMSYEQDDKENEDPAKEAKTTRVKRDFFGRPIAVEVVSDVSMSGDKKLDASSIAKRTAFKGKAQDASDGAEGSRTWVSFNEGFSNAVRKPITMSDLLNGL